jgi:hypothetical protein
MLPAFLLPALLSLSPGGDPKAPTWSETIARRTFDVDVTGVADSHIAVSFRAVVGKEFSARMRSHGGEQVTVRGLLRPDEKGRFILDIQLTETDEFVTKQRAFSLTLSPWQEELYCHGWVWWYRVRLHPTR